MRETIDRWHLRGAILGAFVGMVSIVSMATTGDAQPVVLDVELTRDRLFAGTTDLANFGRDMVVADFNGDGVDDVAISGPRDQSPRGIIRTGQVSIFFGGASFTALTDIVRIGKDGQANVQIFGAADDRIGRHMAAGDLNGDTFADLVVTAQDDPGDGARLDFENEKVYVIFGSAAMPALIQMPIGANVILQRNLSHITDVALGDMNGDGMADLVVADDLSDNVMFPPTPTRNHGIDGGEFNGGAYVMLGRTEWPAALDLATEHDLFIGRGNGVGVFQPQSLAFGNINADHVPPDEPIPPTSPDMPSQGEPLGHELQDLVLGASQEDIAIFGLAKAGQVFALYGRETFMTTGSPALIEVDADMDITIQGAVVNDQVGDAVVVGDVNGDTFGDLLLGAPESGLGVVSTTGVGKVHLVLGKADMPKVIDLFSMSDSEIAYSLLARDIDTKMGETLAIADLNQDGFGDMIMAAPSDPPSFDSSGAVYILMGREVLAAKYEIDLEADIRFEAPLPPSFLASGRLGSSLAVGDLDANGILDLLMGAPEGNIPSEGLPPNETDLAGSGWAALYFAPVPPEPMIPPMP